MTSGGDPELAAGVRKGDVLAGRYRVDKVLGTGGMGVVVAARHTQLHTRVAIKFLHPRALMDSEAVARFAHEARAASRITSEHVARVFDVGTLENGAPFMVMEFLDGRDLATLLRDSGPLPVEQAIDFVLQACVAVADAHGLHIVHRDLKPANLFCVVRHGQPVIKVLDFGISKTADLGTNGAVTNTGAVLGSLLYMAPEQIQSAKDVDHRADIWALGVTTFELMTGKVPFPGATFFEIMLRATTEPPPLLRELRADVPDGLQAVIGKCLEKDRRNRYADLGEMATAFGPFASRNGSYSLERIAGILATRRLVTPHSSPRLPSQSPDAAPAPLRPPAPAHAPPLPFAPTMASAAISVSGHEATGMGRTTGRATLIARAAGVSGIAALGVGGAIALGPTFRGEPGTVVEATAAQLQAAAVSSQHAPAGPATPEGPAVFEAFDAGAPLTGAATALFPGVASASAPPSIRLSSTASRRATLNGGIAAVTLPMAPAAPVQGSAPNLVPPTPAEPAPFADPLARLKPKE